MSTAVSGDVHPAPPTSIAAAVRRFGDDYPQHIAQGGLRVAGVFLLASTAFYLPWMWTSLDSDVREPVPLILRTVQSEYEQDYPMDRLVVIVSDDGHDPVLRRRLTHLFSNVVYHEPPISAPQVVTVSRKPAT
jgi:hypothetical protein